MIPNPVQFNAAGFFKQGAKTFFRDVTGVSAWFANNSDLSYNQNGQFTLVNPGCACVYASTGGIVSNSMQVAIGPDGGPFPVCSPCPTVAASATPTPKAAFEGEPESLAGTGQVMWRFDARSAVDGRIVAAPSGAAVYFITTDGLLHAINSAGQEIFVRPAAAGASPVVAANGAIFAEGPGGGLMRLDPTGKIQLFVATGRGTGPLAAGPDETVYDAADSDLVAIDAAGTTKWQISMPGVRQAAISFGGAIVAVTDGGLTALSADGAVQWTFAPPGGVAGDVAIDATTVYAASSAGTLYAIDLADGSELWHREAAGGSKTRVVTDGAGMVYVGDAAALSAINAAGARAWSSGGFVAQAVAPAVSSSGTAFVAAQGGHLAAIGSDGQLRWVAGDFGEIRSMTFSSSGTLYVISTDGICWSLKEIFDND